MSTILKTNFQNLTQLAELDFVRRVTSRGWIRTHLALNDFNSDLGLGVLVGDVSTLSSGFKGEPIEKGTLG